MALRRAAEKGNVQACCMYTVFAPCCPYAPTRPSLSFHSLHFISFQQPQPINTTRLTLPRPAPNTHTQKSSVRRLIAGSLGMLCPNFVSLMRIHASTQEVRALLDKGVRPDDQKESVRIFAVKGSVSVHIRLVYIAALFALVSGCVVCRAGARCAGSGVTSHTPCTRNHTVTHP